MVSAMGTLRDRETVDGIGRFLLCYVARWGIIAKDSEMCRAYNRLPAVFSIGNVDMLSICDLRTLRRAYSASSDLSVGEALLQIGSPSMQSLVESAVAEMSNPERKVRVLMLRIRQRQRGERAMRGVLAGLNDDTRRVCAVAIQACPNYLEHDEIVERLEAIARDARLKRKLRQGALSMLAGNDGRMAGDLTRPVYDALRRLMVEEQFRFAILFGLVRLALTPRVASLLKEFADSADEGERPIASRALNGARVIHIDAYAADAALHRQIMETCQVAHGRMYYWIPREGMPALSLPIL